MTFLDQDQNPNEEGSNVSHGSGTAEQVPLLSTFFFLTLLWSREIENLRILSFTSFFPFFFLRILRLTISWAERGSATSENSKEFLRILRVRIVRRMIY